MGSKSNKLLNFAGLYYSHSLVKTAYLNNSYRYLPLTIITA